MFVIVKTQCSVFFGFSSLYFFQFNVSSLRYLMIEVYSGWIHTSNKKSCNSILTFDDCGLCRLNTTNVYLLSWVFRNANLHTASVFLRGKKIKSRDEQFLHEQTMYLSSVNRKAIQCGRQWSTKRVSGGFKQMKLLLSYRRRQASPL